MTYVIGLDLGTSGLKGILVNKDGEIKSSSTENYPIISPNRGFSEQNPHDWIDAAVKVLKKIIKDFPEARDKIEGISFSGQMHSLVLLDKNGATLRNAILWNDVRTTKQCEIITKKLGHSLIEITKNKALEGFTLPKILWIQDNEPEIWEKVDKFLLPKDYLGYRLTGNIQMEHSDAAGTLLFNVEKKEWSKEILNSFSINPSICPQLVHSHDQIGFLNKELMNELNLDENISIPVFAGAADNACAAIGAGIVNADHAMLSIGTSGVFLSFENDGKKDYDGNLHYFNHAIPDAYYSMGVTLAAGNSLNWFRENIAQEESFEKLLSNIDTIAPGSDGLLFAPYINGERTPYTDSNIRGAFIGIDIRHNRDHFSRAVIEGITFSLKDSYGVMKNKSNKSFNSIISVGGGAKNKEWLQIQADVFNLKIITLETEQGPSVGAAMIAAVGTGWFENFEDCSKVFVKYSEVVIPNKQNVEIYNRYYSVYKKIYSSIKEISHDLV